MTSHPVADEELTYDVNAFIMQHIENTRKELATSEENGKDGQEDQAAPRL